MSAPFSMSVARRGLAVAAMLLLFAAGDASAQRKSDSPVFRSYKPPEELPLLRQTDPTYQSWQAFQALRKANAGDALAQQEIALRYFTGSGVEADTVKAAAWMAKAAEQNLSQARFNLALLYYNGWGVPWDPFASYRQFLVCARGGMAEAQYAVGIFCIENLLMPEDWEAGYAWIKRAAEADYRPAVDVVKSFEQNLAARHADTVAVVPVAPPVMPVFAADTGSATSREAALREALLRADPDTRRALGMARMVEEGVRADSLDIASVSAAAEAGSPEALTLLGKRAEEGLGGERDLIQAAVYYLRGVRMESSRAGQLLWALGQGGELAAQVKARAEVGDARALYAWAGLLSFGLEVPLLQAKAYITRPQAVGFLRKSAEMGYVPALIELGLWYYSGRWVPQDAGRALALWQEAERRGSPEATLRLAVTTVRQSTQREELAGALLTLQHASEQGAILADIALGYCYERGIQFPRSPQNAAHLYRAAWRRGSLEAYRSLRRLYDALRPPDPEFRMQD
jgi:TPR repeat protein